MIWITTARVNKRSSRRFPGSAGDKAGKKFAQEREVKTWVILLKAQQILPIGPSTHCHRSLPIGQNLTKLKQRDLGMLVRT